MKLEPEHIGNIPAGFKRDEENARRTDSLAQAAEEASEDAGALALDALQKPIREILDHFDPFTMQLEVSNQQPGRHYLWVLANPTVISSYNSLGYKAVQGNDPECEEHKGQHKAAASSLRGVGDVLLYWIPIERWQAIERHYQTKADALQAVEERWEGEFNNSRVGRHFGPLAHGNPNDPLLKRTVFRGTRGQIEKLNDAIKGGQGMPAGVSVRDE